MADNCTYAQSYCTTSIGDRIVWNVVPEIKPDTCHVNTKKDMDCILTPTALLCPTFGYVIRDYHDSRQPVCGIHVG